MQGYAPTGAPVQATYVTYQAHAPGYVDLPPAPAHGVPVPAPAPAAPTQPTSYGYQQTVHAQASQPGQLERVASKAGSAVLGFIDRAAAKAGSVPRVPVDDAMGVVSEAVSDVWRPVPYCFGQVIPLPVHLTPPSRACLLRLVTNPS